jgi:hypothetical protein
MTQQIRWGAIALMVTLIVLAFIVVPAKANGFNCGLRPLPPIGCSAADAHCECDGDGNCRWVFDC